MAYDDSVIEEMIQRKGLNAPRITPQDLEDAIDPLVAPQYHVFPGTTTTICLLTLKNGFTITGESAAVSMDNFDEEVGREVARKEAMNKLWPLLGFSLKDRLAGEEKTIERPLERGETRVD